MHTEDPTFERLSLLAQLGRLDEAERGLGRLLAAEPGHVEAMKLLSDVLDDLGRHEESEVLARRAVVADPADPHAHQLLSQALAGVGQHDAAVRAAEEAVRLDPHNWSTHYSLGIALTRGRRPRTRDALACANRAVALAPHAADAHNLAGMCLADLGMEDEARRAYHEALRLAPHHALVLNNLAALHADGGKLVDASGFLTAGLSVDAQQAMLHQNYDLILYRLMRRLYWSEFCFAVLIGLQLLAGSPWLLRALTGVTMVVVFVVLSRRVLRALPPGAHVHARGLLARSRGWARYGVVLFLITSVVVLTMAVAPHDWAALVGIGFLVMLRYLGMVVIVIGIGSAVASLFRRG